jgi:hypothetical protein
MSEGEWESTHPPPIHPPNTHTHNTTVVGEYERNNERGNKDMIR